MIKTESVRKSRLGSTPRVHAKLLNKRIFERCPISVKRHALTTTAEEIADYWSRQIDENDLNIFWSEAHERCWRCGTTKSLQRCHIVARSLGGSDEPSNLVILCSECHADSPDVDDSEIMWDWLRAYKAASPTVFWVQQGCREYEFMYHRSAQDELDYLGEYGAHFDFENPFQEMVENACNMTRHFGMSHASPSTFAGTLRHFFKKKAASVGAELPDPRRQQP